MKAKVRHPTVPTTAPHRRTKPPASSSVSLRDRTQHSLAVAGLWPKIISTDDRYFLLGVTVEALIKLNIKQLTAVQRIAVALAWGVP